MQAFPFSHSSCKLAWLPEPQSLTNSLREASTKASSVMCPWYIVGSEETLNLNLLPGRDENPEHVAWLLIVGDPE